MKLTTTTRAGFAAVLMAGVGLVTAGGAAAAAGTPVGPGGVPFVHALFAQTDATTGNQVLAYQVNADGTLTFAQGYATDGLGATAAGATADPLASQGGLALADHDTKLIAVNAGSDTVSVFSVQGTQLALTQVVASGGQFPVSIGVHGDLVAVLNSAGAGSVAEFNLVGGQLVPVPGQVRSLGLNNASPPEFHHGAGEVAYSPNGQHLIVTTKLSTDAYDVFSVSGTGELGASPTVTIADTVLPFAFTFDAAGNVVGAEAAASTLSVYHVNESGKLESLGSVADGGAALCWVSGTGNYFYGSNAGSGDVSEFAQSGQGAPRLVNPNAGTAHAGTTDSVVSTNGSTLYVESGGAGTIDAFGIGADGALSHLQTTTIPAGSEGIAVS